MLTCVDSDTSTISIFSVGDPKVLSLVQNQTYTLAAPGPVPDRQDVPHLHDAVLDPTKKFLAVTDLGSDLIRLYKATAGQWSVTPIATVNAVPGSGPRHAGFSVQGSNTFFYTVNELSNTITGYDVMYMGDSAPMFTQLFDISTHGPNGTVPAGTKAAEFVVSPDQNFIVVSSRGEGLLKIPNFDTANSTWIASDPLLTFAVSPKTGSLSFVQAAPAGGINPRGFSLNKAGTLVVSALQDDNRVVVIERDVKTGLLGKIVASATVGVGAGNGPNYALFNE
ncbi:Lactonase, 7-bladed beta-propeller-domain-containing protein [Lasiosphaeria hispida]|uniref:Lactonase, 7-bladed beta-propeller-domain-containing protein n=1 Tax=Lasiosphaeria hispida TaxID=260671 RepID=A0AAJ0MCH7_9PEZI|nr:Lactonase, 7-bladed beta-propeller-domain-containing protein [Lasiosphaeria hispida]